MGRKLVLCLDGTNNKYKKDNTNVLKMYALVDRTQADQLAYYQTGIGTAAAPGLFTRAGKWISKQLDLAIAFLLKEHVTEAYRFLMNFYKDGDEIFIFGFSRGAYTARALAAMLYKVGLLSQGNNELIPFAWDIFKKERDEKLYTGFRHTFCRKVQVRFLGVWDTVSSVGWMWDPKYLQFTQYNPIVQTFRHAVSLDERRAYFPQNLWTNHPPADQDVLEAWFPGVHCDVGGGYLEMESGLSKDTLKWMAGHAEQNGLRLHPKAKEAILPEENTKDDAAPSVVAPIHESLRGWWWIAEYVPKTHMVHHKDGWKKEWEIHGGRHRHVPENINLHRSVIERMEKVPEYRPPNLPKEYHIVD